MSPVVWIGKEQRRQAAHQRRMARVRAAHRAMLQAATHLQALGYGESANVLYTMAWGLVWAEEER